VEAVFAGVLRKTGVFSWCFDGEFVVRCVVERGVSQRVFSCRKVRQLFEIYFFVECKTASYEVVSALGVMQEFMRE
jgi:hypothetical protein